MSVIDTGPTEPAFAGAGRVQGTPSSPELTVAKSSATHGNKRRKDTPSDPLVTTKTEPSAHFADTARPTSPPKVAPRKNAPKTFSRNSTQLPIEGSAPARDSAPLPPVPAPLSPTSSTANANTTSMDANQGTMTPFPAALNSTSPAAADEPPKKKTGTKKRKSMKDLSPTALVDPEREIAANKHVDEKAEALPSPTSPVAPHTTHPASSSSSNMQQFDSDSYGDIPPAPPASKIRKSTSTTFKDSIVSLITSPTKKRYKKGEESDGEREDRIVANKEWLRDGPDAKDARDLIKESKDLKEKDGRDKDVRDAKEKDLKDARDKDAKDAKEREKDSKDKTAKDVKDKVAKDAKDTRETRDSKESKEPKEVKDIKDAKDKKDAASKEKAPEHYSKSDSVTSPSYSHSTSSGASSAPTLQGPGSGKHVKKAKKTKASTSKKSTKICYLQTLPVELILKTLCCLDVFSLTRMAMSSKAFKAISMEPFVWHVVAVKMMRAGQRKPRIYEWQSYCKSIWCFRRGTSLDTESMTEVPLSQATMDTFSRANALLDLAARHIAAPVDDTHEPSSSSISHTKSAENADPTSPEENKEHRSDAEDETAATSTSSHVLSTADAFSTSEDTSDAPTPPAIATVPLPLITIGSSNVEQNLDSLLLLLKVPTPNLLTLLNANFPNLFANDDCLDLRLCAALASYFKIKQTLSSTHHLVLRAVHLPTREMVAIVKVPYIMDMKPQIRMQDESRLARFMKMTDFPFLVSFYGNYFDGKAIWYVNEYCTGGSCRQQLDASSFAAFSEMEMAYILRDVLRGLAFMHMHGFVHGNISASALMLSELRQGRSIAKLRVKTILNALEVSKQHLSASSTTASSSLTRKVYWRAPETQISPKMDIWSIGITLIELAEGRPPNWGVSPSKARMVIQNSPPPSLRHPTSFTAKFRSFLDSCLVKDPNTRPTAMQLLSHPFLADINPAARPKKATTTQTPLAVRSKLTRFNSSPIASTSAITSSRTADNTSAASRTTDTRRAPRKQITPKPSSSAAPSSSNADTSPAPTRRGGTTARAKKPKQTTAKATSSPVTTPRGAGKITRRLSYAGSASTSDTLTHPYLSDSEDNISFALTHSSSRLSFSWSEDWASGSVDVSMDSTKL